MSSTDIFRDVWERKGHNGIVNYRVVAQVREQLVGGIPGDPELMRIWLRARLDLNDPWLEELFRETIAQSAELLTTDEKVDALMKSDAAPKATMFARIAQGPFAGMLALGGRCAKAMLKEAANAEFPGTDWRDKPKGIRHGLKAELAERVFVAEHLIPLGVREARVEERVKHVNGPRGKRSAIDRVEVIDRPRIEFTLRIHETRDAPFLSRDVWAAIWERAEDLGIGAQRSRGDGQFDLETWEVAA